MKRTTPPIAAFIASHEAVRTLVKEAILNPVVFVVKETQNYWDKDTGK